jgi:hypothetical protein
MMLSVGVMSLAGLAGFVLGFYCRHLIGKRAAQLEETITRDRILSDMETHLRVMAEATQDRRTKRRGKVLPVVDTPSKHVAEKPYLHPMSIREQMEAGI